MTTLCPIDRNNPIHIQWLYKVRTHPDVAVHFFALPPRTFEQHLQFLKEALNRDFFIIFFQCQMTGYCQIIHFDDRDEIGFAIHPDWQNRGIGSESIRLLLDRLALSNKKICLIAKSDNLRAIHLYKKHGFTEKERNEEKIVMELLL